MSLTFSRLLGEKVGTGEMRKAEGEINWKLWKADREKQHKKPSESNEQCISKMKGKWALIKLSGEISAEA